jgi:hypothetical protein
LSRAEALLKKVLGNAGARSTGYVLTVEDESLGPVPEILHTAHGTWTVVRPKSELDLRHLLWKSGGAGVVALLPREVAETLPLDLVRRAEKREVVRLEPLDILRAVLDVQVLGFEDPSVVRLALEHLDELRAAIDGRTLPTVIDRRLLDELLLDVCVGARIRRVENAGLLLAEWLRSPPEWSPDLVPLVTRNLPRLLGPEGRLLAWAIEEPDGLVQTLEQLLVRGVLMAIDVEELPEAVWGVLERARGSSTVDLKGAHLRDVIARVAVDAVHALGHHAADYLERAESLGRTYLTPGVLARSTLLKLGLENRCHALVARMKEGLPVGSEDIDWLRRHRAASRMQSEIDLLEEMARLSRWLDTPPADATSVSERVLGYLRDGSFADLAASHLQRALGRSARWSSEARVLLGRWEARRNADNEAFAKLLAHNYVDRWHAEGVVPLHRLWTEAVLKGDPCRRSRGHGGVLVVVLDGCSYPVFVDLLHGLADRRPAIGISSAPGSGRAEGIPALAPLPTITSHARGALFLGELPHDPWALELTWRESGERRTDPARFSQNRALGDRRRKLFLKGDLDDDGASLREAIRDDALDVVAVVFNAIDDLIGGHATGVASRVRPEDIHHFVPTLQEAFAANRKVLVTADHGHTPFLGKERNAGKGNSARWCALEADEPVPEGWIEIDVEGLGGPAGRKAFAWKLGSYRGKPHVGFHGGCGLEEVVVPLAWLVPEGVGADLPTWWYGTESVGEELDFSSVQGGKPPRKRKTSRPKLPQLDLYDGERNRAVIVATSDLSRLGLDDAVLAQLDAMEKSTLLLLAENGSATATELSKVQKRPITRVTGFMTKLRRRLHELGAPSFEVESLPTGDVQYTWTRATRGKA